MSSDDNYLVVEAVINTGADSSVIRLSRTVPVSSTTASAPETGAVVSIVSDANVTYPVVEKGNGVYMSAVINSNAPAKYSLKIFTRDGASYQSDFVQVKNSPTIDSVYYKVNDNGVDIYADTHDPNNNSKYYRWDFVETYIFTSRYMSYGIVKKINNRDTIVDRNQSEQIYQCWSSDTSQNILINSSAKLTKDVITENAISHIPSTSEKLENRYSILVNQYVLAPEAFNYYQQLKKNTETLGTVFDPQPSELPGNVHCLSNPSEPVVGYVTAGTPAKTRIYIDKYRLPAYWVAETPYNSCSLDTLLYAFTRNGTNFENQVAESIYSGAMLPIGPVLFPPDPIPAGWSASIPFCVDCTLRGTKIRPSWWTDANF